MTAQPIESLATHATSTADSLIPDGLADEAYPYMRERIAAAGRELGLTTKKQFETLGILMSDGYYLNHFTKYTTDEASPRLPADETDRQAFRRAVEALIAGTPADGPLPTNDFTVTRHKGLIFQYADAGLPLKPDAALNLGVWLIALADPTLSDAVPLLLRIATR